MLLPLFICRHEVFLFQRIARYTESCCYIWLLTCCPYIPTGKSFLSLQSNRYRHFQLGHSKFRLTEIEEEIHVCYHLRLYSGQHARAE